MHPPRSYPYGEQPHQPPPYSGIAQPQPTSADFPMHAQTTHHSHYQQRPHGSSPYYVPPPPVSPSPAQGTGQFTRGDSFVNPSQRVAEAGYYQSSGVTHPHPEYSSTPYPQPPLNHDSQNHGFIPTPSDLARSYQNYTPGSASQMYQAQQPFHASETDPSRTPVRPSTSHSSSHRIVPSIRTPQPSAAPSTSERYRCDKCSKTFSRSHDRKRHHETQHHPVPAIHRCRFCGKEFSRSDSLKRHLDNGCDEMR